MSPALQTASENPRALAAALALLAMLGCREKPPPARAAAPPGPVPAVASPVPSAPAIVPSRKDPACAAPLELSSSRVTLRAPAGALRLGVLAGLKNADEQNLTHLRLLVAELVRRGAEVLLADGDVGDTLDEQQTLLGLLTDTALPVLVVAGNREVRSDLDAAEAELRKRGARLTDLSQIRAVDLGDVMIVGLAGAFERRQAHADGVCVYGQKDLDALALFLDKLGAGPRPILLAMAVPPRGHDKLALDASEGQNVGDARIVPLLSLRRAAFGVFGQVWEAGGRAVDGAGNPLPPGTISEQLYVNPGAADRTPWPMSDGSVLSGQAALLTVQGRRASVEFVRTNPPATARSR